MTYMEEKKRTEELSRIIEDQQQQPSGHTHTQVVTKTEVQEVEVDRPKKVDSKKFANLLMARFQPVLHEVTERRKKACLNKLHNLMAEGTDSLRSAFSRTTEEVITVRTIS